MPASAEPAFAGLAVDATAEGAADVGLTCTTACEPPAVLPPPTWTAPIELLLLFPPAPAMLEGSEELAPPEGLLVVTAGSLAIGLT